jgi:hypothetical protein
MAYPHDLTLLTQGRNNPSSFGGQTAFGGPNTANTDDHHATRKGWSYAPGVIATQV